MELLHQSGEMIAQRYRILDTLGQGGVGTTYAALDLQNDERVALKALSLRRMSDWKKMELFEREARILAQLNHPAIPRYLDYFQVDTPQDCSFYIAQQLAEGKTLAALVENGWRPDEAEVRGLAIQILEILVYLQEFTPPVIHRDIKPQNIILQSLPSQQGDEGTFDQGFFTKNASTLGRGMYQNISSPIPNCQLPIANQVFLVDFGAVQDTYHHTIMGGSTVVGTYGYMAPEQFRGQAVLSTDLYGLGTTLLFLLTGKSPADLPQRQLKIDFRSHVRISTEFADWLEMILEPIIENRFSSAKEALAVLQGEQTLTNSLAPRRLKPKNTPITLTKTKRELVVDIPPVWFRTKYSRFFGFLTLVWNGIFWLPFLAYHLLKTLYSPLLSIVLGYLLSPPDWLRIFFTSIEQFTSIFNNPLFAAFLGVYVAIGLFLLVDFIEKGICRTKLEIDRKIFHCQGSFGRTEDINQVKLSSIGLSPNKKPITVCEIRCGLRKYQFGLFLTQREKEWLVGEISAFLEKMREHCNS